MNSRRTIRERSKLTLTYYSNFSQTCGGVTFKPSVPIHSKVLNSFIIDTLPVKFIHHLFLLLLMVKTGSLIYVVPPDITQGDRREKFQTEVFLFEFPYSFLDKVLGLTSLSRQLMFPPDTTDTFTRRV